MARVFLSHASQDTELAKQLHTWLRSQGHEAFLDADIDDGIRGGEDWTLRLLTELQCADAVLCLVTPSFLASHWGTAEVAIAHIQGKRIVPLTVDGADARAIPLLAGTQYVQWDEGESARARISQALHDLGEGLSGPADGDRSPFPGLLPFDEKLAWAFAGRTREIVDLTDLLRSPAVSAERQIVVVVGPSGCGKSSLVQAGVAAELAKDPGWMVLPVVVPGDDPIGALSTSIATQARSVGLDWTTSSVRRWIDNDLALPASAHRGASPTSVMIDIVESLHRGPEARRGTQSLLIIDQMEELFTRADPASRARMAQLLATAMTGPMRVVATLRSEFLGVYQRSTDFGQVPLRSFLLAPLADAMLRSVIEIPARRSGIHIEDGLVDALVADTGHGDALPLLAFTLNQLADGVGRGGTLSMARYLKLHGVTGVLKLQAGEALEERLWAGRSRKDVLNSLLALVTVDDDLVPARRRAAKDTMQPDVLDDLRAFERRRLLTTEEIEGRAYFAIAHERFITDWSPLAEAVAEQAVMLQTQRQLERAAAEWAQADRPTSYLWSHGRLAVAFPELLTNRRYLPLFGRLPTSAYGTSPATTTVEFVEASRSWSRIRVLGVVAAVLLVVSVVSTAGIIAMNRSRESQEQRLLAVSRGLVDRADSLRDTDPLLALQLGVAADRIRSGPDTRSSLLETLVETRFAGRAVNSLSSITALAMSPDNRLVAASDGRESIGLWTLSVAGGRKLVGPVRLPQSGVRSLLFARDGRHLIVGRRDGGISLVNVANPRKPVVAAELPATHVGAITVMSLSPDGSTLATAGNDRSVQLWSMAFPEKPSRIGRPLQGQLGPVLTVSFSTGAPLLAVGSADGTFALWDVRRADRPRLLRVYRQGEPTPVHAVDFSADGRELAVATASTITLWNPLRPRAARPYDVQSVSHTEPVTTLLYGKRANLLVSADRSGHIRLWDTTNPLAAVQIGHPLRGSDSSVEALALSSDNKFLISGGQDGRLLVWNLQPFPVTRYAGSAEAGGAPIVVRAHPHRALVATGTDKGTIGLLDVSRLAKPRAIGNPVNAHNGRVAALAFSPDGRILASGGYDRTVRLWDVSDPAAPRPLGQPLSGAQGRVAAVTFSPDGRLLVAGGYDRAIRIWNVGDPQSPAPFGQVLDGHTNTVTSLAFTSGGQVLVSGGRDGLVVTWRLDKTGVRTVGYAQASGKPPILNLVSPAGTASVFGATADGTVVAWDVSDPSHLRQVSEMRVGDDSALPAMDVSPRGLEVAGVTNDAKVVIWDTSSLNLPRQLGDPMSTGDVSLVDLSFGHDGSYLVGARSVGMIEVWGLQPLESLRRDLLRRACARSGNGLSRGDWERYVPGLAFQRTCP